jgi:hypothetical protein
MAQPLRPTLVPSPAQYKEAQAKRARAENLIALQASQGWAIIRELMDADAKTAGKALLHAKEDDPNTIYTLRCRYIDRAKAWERMERAMEEITSDLGKLPVFESAFE